MFIPKARIRCYQYPCWFTSELRHLSKCLCTLRKKISKHPSPYLQSKLVAQESDLRDKIQHAKSYYEAQIVRSFAGSSNSKIYNYIHSLSNASSIPSTVFLDSQSASSDISRAELFNTFFHSIYTVSSFSLPSVDNHAATLPTLSNISFSEVEVLHALSALDPTKSMGTNRIGPRLLRSCSLALYIPLHHLFSVSITRGIIPTEWKCHSITPVFKTGDKSSVKNYRPISLLCVTSKVLERLIYDKLCKFIIEHNIISCTQFGFLEHRSTVQQLLLFLNDVRRALHDASCSVIYLDFRKAFDSVPRNELLLKLMKICVTDNLWLWFREYLTNRYQHVSINSCASSILFLSSQVFHRGAYWDLYCC